VRIRQYVYFGLWSSALTASQITGRLGIEPTDFSVRGSRIPDPPYPRSHRWMLKCDQAGLRVEEQIERVMTPLLSRHGQIAALVEELSQDDPPGGAKLQVVRYYDDEDGEEGSGRETVTPDGSVFERLPGQYQLLGWHVDSETMDFLRAVGAEVDVDEYGY
jgi:hypothetical protein